MPFSSVIASRRTQLQRLTAFLVLYTIVFSVPFIVVLLGAEWLKRHFESSWWLVPSIISAMLAIFATLTYLMFIRRSEAELMTDQRRYHRTLIAASSGMTQIKDIKRLCNLIVHMVNRTVGLTNSALFLYQPKEQRYVLAAVRYRSLMPGEMVVAQADPLIQLLHEEKDLVVMDEIQGEIDTKNPDERTKRMAWAYSWMRKLDARLMVPSFSGERMLAFLVLGAKRSGDRYTTDDIAIFSGLANQAALAIENAMFFEELRNNEAYMIQSEKLASLGQLASGMAHEIHNPLTIISGEAQLYLERFKGQDEKVDEVLKSIIEECQRAADITRRILRFAKPAPSDLARLDLKTTVEETMMLASYQVRMDRVERVLSIPPETPKVRGNQNQLQEVILNLILNACQAMGEKGGRLEVKAAAHNHGMVQIQVADTGPGIAANKMSKIFEPFFTTKATGTGLGLFVSQRIIKSHGGTMEVASTEGKGTCFTIRLPIWKETEAPAGVAATAPPASKA